MSSGPAVQGLPLDDLPEVWDLPHTAEPLISDGKFRVRLANFEGPFDLLLSLIGRRQLDVTEVALSQVTDDFIGYLTAAGDDFDLDQATEFLIVAATLLDLKAARLLPAAEVDDEEDLALLEARDLLFARLLQYRAYKLAANHLKELYRRAGQWFGRQAELEPRFAALNPELQIAVDLHQFAAIAANALKPRPVLMVSLEHIHAPRVSVSEQMVILIQRLSRAGSATFRALVADCESSLEVVARFLGLLELYRDGSVAFDQAEAMSELTVRWVSGEEGTGNEYPEIDRIPDSGPVPVDSGAAAGEGAACEAADREAIEKASRNDPDEEYG
jgi:segregation and condensation protein A